MTIDMEHPSGGWDYGIHAIKFVTKTTTRVYLNSGKNRDSFIILWTAEHGHSNSPTAYLTFDEAEALGIALIDLANKGRKKKNGKD